MRTGIVAAYIANNLLSFRERLFPAFFAVPQFAYANQEHWSDARGAKISRHADGSNRAAVSIYGLKSSLARGFGKEVAYPPY